MYNIHLYLDLILNLLKKNIVYSCTYQVPTQVDGNLLAQNYKMSILIYIYCKLYHVYFYFEMFTH